jgi:hypothetical protein
MTVWTPDSRTYTDWNVSTGGDTQRITEATITRITEDGRIRIIERFEAAWTEQPPTYTTWT